MKGDFVSFSGGIVVLSNAGKPGTPHAVKADATFTCATAHCKSLADCKPGDHIALIGNPATAVDCVCC